MNAPLFNGPRTWKYALPGTLVVLLIPVIGKMLLSPDPETRYWAMVPFGFCCLLVVMTLVNLWKYMTAHASEMFSEHQAALSRTPLVMLAEAMKQMHPEAVRVLNRFGVRTSWEVRVNAETFERDWVLAGTNAHFGFIEFVLSRSGKALSPKRFFAEGSKKWDPDHIVEDREQYDDLEKWMFARTMITRSHGDFKPAEFIPPWTPAYVLEAMGLTGEQDLYRAEEEARKDLAAVTGQRAAISGQPSAVSDQQSAVSKNGNGNGKKAEEIIDLLPEEIEAITQENMAYAERNQVLKGDSNG